MKTEKRAPKLSRLNDNEMYNFSAGDLAELLNLDDHCRHGLTSIGNCGNCSMDALSIAIDKIRELKGKS